MGPATPHAVVRELGSLLSAAGEALGPCELAWISTGIGGPWSVVLGPRRPAGDGTVGERWWARALAADVEHGKGSGGRLFARGLARGRRPELGEWARRLSRLDARLRASEASRRSADLRALGLRAGAAAHDLRNLMSLASLQVGELCEVGVGSRGGEMNELSGTIAEARALSAALLGGVAAEPRPVALAPVVRAELERAGRLGAGRVRVAARGPVEGSVWGRPAPLARALANLLSNAVRVSPAGTTVEVRCGRRGARRTLSVRDRGPGLDRATWIERFGAGRHGRGGTGFGTASLAACTEELGAELELASERGRGSRFTLLLRAADGVETVVVDPDARSRERWLDALGPRAVGASGCDEARRILAAHGPTSVLLARGTPGAGRLREHCEARGVRLEWLGLVDPHGRTPSRRAAARR